MTDAILRVSNGTTTVDLINPSRGFHLNSWIPAITDYKGGGTFQNPPLADWRQLRDVKWENAQENMGLHINGANPDVTASDLQKLRQLLEEANQYWTTDWQNNPVWVEAKAKCETNSRYAVIVKGRLANDNNYFSQPFTGQVASMQDLPLQIERRAWLSNQPTVGTATNISAVEDYDGRSYGNVDSSGTRVPTTANEVYIANKRNTANLTDIYNFDATGASFSANLLDAALPTTLFPSPAAVGDIIYFGIDTSLADSGIFSSLVFDISTAAAATSFTLVWEYSRSFSWNPLTVQDNTNSFQNTGVNSVHWEQPADWQTRAENGITGYWVRVRISALTGAFTNPIQQNRDIYSIVWPYVEIQESEIGGDITSLMQLRAEIVSDADGPDGSSPDLYSNYMIAGLRSLSRGTNFTAYLNCADEQNNSDITVSLGTNVAFSSELSLSSTGRTALWSTGAVADAMADRVLFTINKPLAQEFFGTFRAYIYVIASGTDNDDFQYRIRTKTGTAGLSFSLSSTPATAVGGADTIVDLGEVSIQPPTLQSGDDIDKLEIAIQGSCTAATISTRFYELVLIPTDESVFESVDTQDDSESTIENGRYLRVSSLIPKQAISSTIHETADDDILGKYRTASPGAPILQKNSRQRIWFFSTQADNLLGDDVDRALVAIAYKIQITRNQRYLSLRGDN